MAEKKYKGVFSFKTDRGRIRVSNEDQARVAVNSAGEVLLCVCDGMGGQNRGDYASKTAMDYIMASFREKRPHLPLFLESRWISKTLREANSALFRDAADPRYHGMGTTCVLALIVGSKMILANIGDSRAYLLTPEDELKRLSEDQTYVDYLYKTGKISESEAETSSERHVLMNALGIFGTVSLDKKTLDYHGESVLLCSDGLYNNLAESEIAALLSTDERPDQKVSSLINEANANGGSDNIGIAFWESIHD